MSVLAIPPGSTLSVQKQDVHTSAGTTPEISFEDAAALEIVLRDFGTAEAWLSNNQWNLQWRESRILYQSPRTSAVFEGSATTRANVSRFTVAKQVNSLAPAITGGIFSDSVPFEVEPKPRTTQAAADAWKHLLSTLLDEAGFKQTLTAGIEGMVNQGTVIFKVGFESSTVIEKHYRRKEPPASINLPLQQKPMIVPTAASDEFHVEEREVTRTRPWIEKCELGTVYVDPKWNRPNQLHKAKYIVHECYVTYEDLKILSQNPDYDIPDEQTLRDIFLERDAEQTVGISSVEQGLTQAASGAISAAERRDADTSEDPLLKPMQILERWTEDTCMVVLQRKLVIRNGRHNMPHAPFFAANFWNMEDTGYGMGVGRIAGSDQRVDQGTINAALDIISMAVNPSYAVSRAANTPTQNIRTRLGGIIDVDGDPRQAYALIEQPRVPPDVWTVTQISRENSESATGADQASVQGAMPGPKSSFGRSGTGAGILGKASSARIQAPLDRVVDGVMLPFCKFLFEEVRERMPTSEIREILADAEAEDLLVDMQDFMDARLKFDVLAGSRLAARSAMATSLPFLLQVFENQALLAQLNQTGYKVDAMELVRMVMDVSEWKNERQIVVQMTPQEMQQMQASKPDPNAGKMQLEQSKLAQQHQNDMELEDQKIHGRIVTQSVKAAGQKAVESPLDRAASFATRDQLEQTIKESPYFGGGQ